MQIKECLAFDDVLLVPKHSCQRSRLEVDTSVKVAGKMLKAPLISSPMDTITEEVMANAMSKFGGMGFLHRFLTVDQQVRSVKRLIKQRDKEESYDVIIAPSVGVTESEKKRFNELSKYDLDIIVIDVANGHSVLMEEMISYVKERRADLPIIAGNVATGDGFRYLAELGVSGIRVGIGSGSICKTRIQTGFGIPLLSSILDCASAKEEFPDVALLADGGIRYPSDLVKSLAAGADAVVCGGIFAGTQETPGRTIKDENGNTVKEYYGMASAEAQFKRSGGLKEGTCSEGVSTVIPFKGSVEHVIKEFLGGLRSGLTYAGAKNIGELRQNAEFVKVTHAGLLESHAYGTKK